MQSSRKRSHHNPVVDDQVEALPFKQLRLSDPSPYTKRSPTSLEKHRTVETIPRLIFSDPLIKLLKQDQMDTLGIGREDSRGKELVLYQAPIKGHITPQTLENLDVDNGSEDYAMDIG